MTRLFQWLCGIALLHVKPFTWWGKQMVSWRCRVCRKVIHE